MSFEYHTPMEPQYYGNTQTAKRVEDPIVPISELGTTVPEKPPNGGTFLTAMDASIRAGAGQLQLVFMTPSNAPFGGRPKAYGEEVRRAIKEKAKAAEVNLGGVEMPTSTMTNLSGLDMQRGVITEEHRQNDMQEVRDALDFVADVAEGGGVDIWSQESPRTIFDAEWNKDVDPKTGNPLFKAYEGEEKTASKILIDQRTGKMITEIRMDQKIHAPKWKKVTKGQEYLDSDGNKRIANKEIFVDLDNKEVSKLSERIPEFDPEKNTYSIEPYDYERFREEAKLYTEERKKKFEKEGREFIEERDEVTPEEAFFWMTTQAQENVAKGYATSYIGETKKDLEELDNLKKLRADYEKKLENATEEEKLQYLRAAPKFRYLQASDLAGGELKNPVELIDEAIERVTRTIEGHRDMVTGQLQQVEDLKLQRENVVSATKYAVNKSKQSYAELGIYAMNEQRHRGDAIKKDLYVGPELGWPSAWGGHPREFVELVQDSREKMVEMLTSPTDEEGKKNPYYDPSLSKEEARKRAEKHIKGCFDTSHMGMWLNNFRRIPNESESERLKEFNKWFLKEVDNMIDANVVGSIQAVDSMTGQHSHLPPGEGVLPVVKAVERFKERGFNGFVVSEGHEEESFGAQRMLTQMWKNFGSPLGSPVDPLGGRYNWGNVQNSYFGKTYSTNLVVGAYAPSNDWKFWSEVPLE